VSTNGGSNWTNDTADAGNSTGTLIAAAATTTQSGYQCRAVFTNAVGSATPSAATLTVLPSNAPVVTTVSPRIGGPFSVVLISGRNLTNVQAMSFGGPQHPAWYLSASSSLVIALVPLDGPGTVDITVRTRVGTSVVSTADRFTFR